MIEGIEQRTRTMRDGTQIGYQVFGPVGAPTVVLANGLGGTYLAFEYLYRVLGEYRVICWDYRGLYSSGPAAVPTSNTVAHQVDDLIELLQHENLDKFVVVGWSMGVQVSFELLRRHADRVLGILAINGTSGRAFRTVMGSKLVSYTIPAALALIKSNAGLVGKVTGLVAGTDALIAAMVRLGMVAPSVDREIFKAVAGSFKTLDWRIYSDLLTEVDRHDATDLLSSVKVPTTIITADRDIITPPATAEGMHRQIPDSRLVMIRGGSHYTPVEFPSVIQDELQALLERVERASP